MKDNKVVINIGRGYPAEESFLTFNKQSGKEAANCWAEPNLHNNAFTLIELLVVVLIIGILAAVAVPQYQKAVERSQGTQALTLLKAVQQVYDAYYIANGTYPSSWEQLDINIPWEGNTKYLNTSYDPSKSNENWAIQLHWGGGWKGVSIGRISGPYQGAAFGFFYNVYNANDIPLRQILCIEDRSTSVVKPFTKKQGDYCQKIFKAPSRPQTHVRSYFTLP